jgi:hypothetical protein
LYSNKDSKNKGEKGIVQGMEGTNMNRHREKEIKWRVHEAKEETKKNE